MGRTGQIKKINTVNAKKKMKYESKSKTVFEFVLI